MNNNFEYEKRLQKKLMKVFCKEFYHHEEISKILGINLNTTKELTKNLKYHEERGYKNLDIVLRCMNGILYAR